MLELQVATDLTPAEVRDLLEKHISGGSIVLDRAWFPELGAILSGLGVSSLTLSPVQNPTLDDRTVTLIGTGEFLGVSNAVRLVIYVPITGAFQIYLEGSRNETSPKWKFGDAFTALPDYTAAEGAALVQKKSFFFELVINDVTFVSADFAGTTGDGLAFAPGLNLGGELTKAPPLDQLSFVIPEQDWPLALAGTLVLHGANPPDVDLRALAPNLSFQLLGAMRLDPVFLWLRVVNATDPSESASRIGIAAQITVGSLPPMIIAADLLQGDFVWAFEARPTGRGFLKGGIGELTQLVGGSTSWLQLPDAVLQIADFDLEYVTFGIVPKDFSISFLSIALATPPGKDWIPPLPKLRVTDVRISWTIYNPGTKADATGAVEGLLHLGDEDPAKLLVSATMPEFILSIDLAYDTRIDVVKIIQHFIGPVSGLPNFQVYQLYAWANVSERAFGLNAAIDLGWNIVIVPHTLEILIKNLFLNISYTPVTLSGDISANLELFGAEFNIAAEYPGSNGGWIFSGAMNPGSEISVKSLAEQFLQRKVDLPAGLDIALTKLAATVRTKNSTYTFNTAIRWRPNIEGFPLHELNAELMVETKREKADDPANFSGFVQTDFLIGRLKIIIRFAFEPESKTLTFQIGAATATLVQNEIQGKKLSVLTISFGDLTLGEVIEYLVNLADPSSNFKLSAPWNVLNSINLKNLSLEVNLTTRAVGISYKFEPELDLVLLGVQQIGLEYVQRNGKGTVDIKIGCRFLEKTYEYGRNPLEWDLLNDPPPAVPGKGPQLLDIQYVGLGQHLTLANLKAAGSVKQVIDELAKSAVPSTDPQIALPPGVVFDGQSQWLIGAQFTVAGTVSLSFVFNDPNLYGLLISLAGEKAQKFAGLSFEILYKKVTEDIGLYHIELKLPDAVRQLEFGSVSLTLPIVTLDIYTNGNFRIDFGFPRGLDFSRSFSVQAFPFVGFGGLYFALLNGATSETVPRIDNGTFSPVIEFGLALSLGLGKTINKGVLAAGLTVTVIGVFEGTIAWFNPENAAVKSDRFFLLQGTVAIVGRLFGKVDFGIVSAEVEVTAYASVTVRIQAYKAILFRLEVGVSVSVRLKVLFVTVSFSFSLQLKETFTIGSDSRPPWHEVPGAVRRKQLRAQRMLYRLQAAATLPRGQQIAWNWTPPKFWSKPEPLSVLLAPSFSVADRQYLYKSQESGPQVQAVMQLFLENSIDPAAKRPAAVRRVMGKADERPFNVVALALFRWALNARLGRYEGEVRTTELEEVQEELAKNDVVQQVFRWEQLNAFLENFQLNIAAPPPDAAAHNRPEEQRSGAIFPMIPVLAYTKPDGTRVNFGESPVTGVEYQAKVGAYFQQLQSDPKRDVARDPLSMDLEATWPPRKPLTLSATETLAAMVFRDYFAMAMKAMVQGALSSIAKYRYEPKAGETLDQIAADFGVTAESVLSANQGTAKLRDGLPVSIAGVLYQVKGGDALAAIIARFPAVTPQAIAEYEGNRSAQIFQPGAGIVLDGITYTVAAGDTIEFIASFLSVRNGQRVTDEAFGWMRQTIVDQNGARIDFAIEPLPPGTVLEIPVIGSANFVSYTTRVHDTLDSVTGTFCVLQLNLIDPAFLAALKNRYPVIRPGEVLEIPALLHVAVGSDSFAWLATLLNNPVSKIALANARNEEMLAPLAVLEIPPFTIVLSNASTIAELADQYNLTLAELAQSFGPLSVFADSQEIIAADAAKADIGALSEMMLRAGEFNNVSATVSRFLLHGLRVPDPEDQEFQKLTVEQILAGTQIFDIYGVSDRMGQQFALSGDSIDITFEKTGGESWIAFDGDPAQPRLRVLLSDFSGELPATTFRPHCVPELSPFVIDAANRYELTQVIHWQTAELPPFASFPDAGEPTIWPLPETLMRKLETAPDAGLPFGVFSIPVDAARGVKPSAVKRFEWATMVEFQISREAEDAAPGSNAYVILGADQDDRALLHDLWVHMRREALSLYLLYSPNPADVNPSGLATDKLNRVASFQLKANLSTVTHSGPQALESGFRLAPAGGDYFATLENAGAADFIRLLWEASVVGTGGFYLHYATASGEGLPGHVFDENGRATLGLLIVRPRQDQTAYAFTNCALIGDNVQPSDVHVFAEKLVNAESPEPDVVQAALFPAGDAGFKLRRPDPDPEEGLLALATIDKTATLYNLLSYQLREPGRAQPLSRQGIPIGPNEQDPDATGGLQLPAWLKADPAFWDYKQVVPVYRIVAGLTSGDCAALPTAKRNPYAGIERRMALQLDFAFYEVYGNRMNATLGSGESTELAWTMGYFDDLIPVLQWPGVGLVYRFGMQEGGAQLSVGASMQLTPYVPGGGTSVAAAVAAASSDALKYRNVYYQAAERDVKFTLATSVNASSVKRPYVVADRRPFVNLAAGAYVYLTTVSEMKPVGFTLAAQSAETLESVAREVSAAGAALLEANAQLRSAQIFGAPVQIPKYHVLRYGDSLTSLSTALGAPVTTLAELNRDVPLVAGTVIVVKPREIRVEAGATDTLEAIAESARATVAGIAMANQAKTDIFRKGVELTVEGVTLAAQDDDSFLILQGRFNEQLLGVTVDAIAAGNQDVPDIFRDGAELRVDEYVVRAGDTLGSIAARGTYGTLEELADWNADAPNLWESGTPLLYAVAGIAPGTETLAEMVEAAALTYAQLAAFNGSTRIASGASFAVPDLAGFSNENPNLYAGYCVSDARSLTAIAERFGTTGAVLGELNRYVPGILAAGEKISIGQPPQSYTIQATDTLETVFEFFKRAGVVEEYAAFVPLVEGFAIFDTGSLMFSPLPALSKPASLRNAASSLGVASAQELAGANRAMFGFLRKGAAVALQDPAGGEPKSLDVRAYDTLNTLVYRFQAELGIETTVDQIVAQNEDVPELVAAGSRFAVPPPGAEVRQTVTAEYPSKIFEVTVALGIARDPALLAKGVKPDSAAAAVSSPVAPDAQIGGNATQSLTRFALDFEAAFQGLKAATGKSGIASAGSQKQNQIWAVNFGAQGIHVAPSGQPVQYFGLLPLSNRLISRNDVPITQYSSVS